MFVYAKAHLCSVPVEFIQAGQPENAILPYLLDQPHTVIVPDRC